jgi:voltage-gated sodium channel
LVPDSDFYFLLNALKNLIESKKFELAIIFLIVLNAITLGLETSPSVMSAIGPILVILDKTILAVFVLEIVVKLLIYRTAFFRDPWRIFDILVVGIALVPATGGLSVLRALRILRVLRLVSVVPSLRKVVGGLMAALPGMGSITLLLSLVFYVFAVMATKLYGGDFPQWFGSLGDSAYSLFQIMTLESWSMGIVRPVMEIFPLSWVFFIIFILCTSFTVLNLFIGIIVSAMQSEHEDSAHEDREQLMEKQDQIMSELQELKKLIAIQSTNKQN